MAPEELSYRINHDWPSPSAIPSGSGLVRVSVWVSVPRDRTFIWIFRVLMASETFGQKPFLFLYKYRNYFGD